MSHTILIIEDEIQAAIDLQLSIKSLQPAGTVIEMVDSVEAGIDWLGSNPLPQLIFSDIQLGDGLAFDIFKQVPVQCPVIFCTAYDQYALQAFQNNGIDYLLKPVDDVLLKKSLVKLDAIKQTIQAPFNTDLLQQLTREISGLHKTWKTTFLVSYRDKMIPVSTNDILFFRISEEVVEVVTTNGQQYRLPDSLDYIETLVDPGLFYRANRQYLLAFMAIKEVETYFERKLLVRLTNTSTEPVIISKAKASHFLKWIESR